MSYDYNNANERIKYAYRVHLRRAWKKDHKTIDAVMKHIRIFEERTKLADFKDYKHNTADKYISDLQKEGKSLSFIHENLRGLREFLKWLERQRGYSSKIDYNHIDYLSLSQNEINTAKATNYRRSYKIEEIIKMAQSMPSNTLIDRRNKAMVSLQVLCGLRNSELRTVKIKNLIEEDNHRFIYVNPKDMEVKFAKTREANFMPLPDDLVQNVISWRDFLLESGFDHNDPLFPQIPSHFGQQSLLQSKLTHEPIKSGSTILAVFKKSAERAGLPYYPPHTFRHSIAKFAASQSPDFLNAVRQSLGHESIDTTMTCYGKISPIEQRQRIASIQLSA